MREIHADQDTLIVKILNAVPEVTSVTASSGPVAVGTEITATAAFKDDGTDDTHTAVLDMGRWQRNPG